MNSLQDNLDQLEKFRNQKDKLSQEADPKIAALQKKINAMRDKEKQQKLINQKDKYLNKHLQQHLVINKKINNLWQIIKKQVSQEEGLYYHAKNDEAWDIAYSLTQEETDDKKTIAIYREVCELLKGEEKDPLFLDKSYLL